MWLGPLALALALAGGCRLVPMPRFRPPSRPVDPDATEETRNLYRNLKGLAGRGIFFGHQDSTAYGVGWQAEQGRSDIRDVCGSYPAVYGWDIGHVGEENNVDGVPFERIAALIREAYARGGINTISAHMRNPVTGKSFEDTTPAVPAILPGGEKHAEFKATLDRVAEFMAGLRDDRGRAIPVIFRPWHEHTHDRFWWGTGACSREEFMALWRFTVEYLRDAKGVHHLLYAYSPDDVCLRGEKNEYLDRYPGDAYVDVFGFDDYDSVWEAGRGAELARRLAAIVGMAERRGKIPALTETGKDGVGIDAWLTEVLFEPIEQDPAARRIAYVLVWRNARKDHHFAPYPGHSSAPDLVRLRQDPFVLFEDDLPDMYR